jgi:hypothetical protein
MLCHDLICDSISTSALRHGNRMTVRLQAPCTVLVWSASINVDPCPLRFCNGFAMVLSCHMRPYGL